jgi:hypothetical protein
MSEKICDLQTEVVTFGLKLNYNKTKELQISLKITSNTNVNNAATDRVEQFTYLGNALKVDGGTTSRCYSTDQEGKWDVCRIVLIVEE